MSNQWLSSLKTENPQEGFELAIKLSRMGVKYNQSSEEIRNKLRPVYGQGASDLIASSNVIAVHFQTVASANNY